MKQSTVNSNIKRIAVICERDRAYGRGVCLGIAEAATYEKNWSLEFLDYPEQVNVTRLKGFDGVIARISNEQIAAELTKAKLPVVDIYTDIIRPEFGSIDGDQPTIGRLAAEYFLKRRYKSFAYHTALFCCHDVRAWQVLALCRLEKNPRTAKTSGNGS